MGPATSGDTKRAARMVTGAVVDGQVAAHHVDAVIAVGHGHLGLTDGPQSPGCGDRQPRRVERLELVLLGDLDWAPALASGRSERRPSMSGAGGVSVSAGTPRSVSSTRSTGVAGQATREHHEPQGARRAAYRAMQASRPRNAPANAARFWADPTPQQPGDAEPLRQLPRDAEIVLGAPAAPDDRERDRIHAPRLSRPVTARRADTCSRNGAPP